MRDDQLLMQYIEQLKRDPHASPPRGLDPKTAAFARQLMKQSRKERIWQQVLTELEGDQPVQNVMHFPKKRNTNSLTLTALAMLVLLVLAVVFTMSQLPGNDEGEPAFAALQNETETPTSDVMLTPLRELPVQVAAGINFNQIDTLMPEDTVPVLAINEESTWYQIMLDDGRIGWVTTSSALVSVTGSLDTLSIFIPTATLTFTPTSVPTATTTVTPSPFKVILPTTIPLSITPTPVIFPVLLSSEEISCGTVITDEMVIQLSGLEATINQIGAGVASSRIIGQQALSDIPQWQLLFSAGFGAEADCS